MSFMHSVGSVSGKTAAYIVEGTRLSASQFAHGAAEGYVSKADELRAKREALRASVGMPAAPTAQRKIKTAV